MRSSTNGSPYGGSRGSCMGARSHNVGCVPIVATDNDRAAFHVDSARYCPRGVSASVRSACSYSVEKW